MVQAKAECCRNWPGETGKIGGLVCVVFHFHGNQHLWKTGRAELTKTRPARTGRVSWARQVLPQFVGVTSHLASPLFASASIASLARCAGHATAIAPMDICFR
jgi:hypothetical protein